MGGASLNAVTLAKLMAYTAARKKTQLWKLTNRLDNNSNFVQNIKLKIHEIKSPQFGLECLYREKFKRINWIEVECHWLDWHCTRESP